MADLRGGEAVAHEAQPRVRVSLESASRLAAATAATGALNTALASFLLRDPFGVGVSDLAADLQRLRDAGVSMLRAVEVATAAEEGLDLDLVAEAAVEAVGDALALVDRYLEVARRIGVKAGAEREVERLGETVEGIGELLAGGALSWRSAAGS